MSSSPVAPRSPGAARKRPSDEQASHQSSKRRRSEPYPAPIVFINGDKAATQLIRTSDVPWTAAGSQSRVRRRVIERVGFPESARATTIVEFDPDQSFPAHDHPGGEEFLVLDGVWSDKYGDFPRFSYIRNYIGSAHKPSIGKEGCRILVKLSQMTCDFAEVEHQAWRAAPPAAAGEEGVDGDPSAHWQTIKCGGLGSYEFPGTVKIELQDAGFFDIDEEQKGTTGARGGEASGSKGGSLALPALTKRPHAAVQLRELFCSPHEHSFCLLIQPDAAGAPHKLRLRAPAEGGAEFLVVEGALTSRLGVHDEQSWTRLRDGGDEITVEVLERTYVWVKEGHLRMNERHWSEKDG